VCNGHCLRRLPDEQDAVVGLGGDATIVVFSGLVRTVVDRTDRSHPAFFVELRREPLVGGRRVEIDEQQRSSLAAKDAVSDPRGGSPSEQACSS